MMGKALLVRQNKHVPQHEINRLVSDADDGIQLSCSVNILLGV